MQIFRIDWICSLLILSGCLGSVEGNPIPQDKLYFPSILFQNSPQKLSVVNTNLDLQYKTGSISEIDLSTRTISNTVLIGSQPGQLIGHFITSQNVPYLQELSSGKFISLPYNAPYFLVLLPDQSSGLLGYLTSPTNELWDSSRFSLLKDQPELQYFTFDSANGFQIKQNLQISTCFKKPNRLVRRIARLGGIQIINKNIYILAEFFIDDPRNINLALKHVFLIQTSLDQISKGSLCGDSKNIMDLTMSEKAQAARGIIVTQDEKKVYIILDENPLLLSIDTAQNIVDRRVNTCQHPSTLKLSPDEQTLLVACSKSNELAAYNASDLSWFGKYLGGNGPLDILFELPPSNRIFVSYQLDHKIGIFQYENTPTSLPRRSLSSVQWLELSR